MSAGWGNALNDGSAVLTAMPAWASFMIDNEGGKMDGKFGVAKTPHGFYFGGTYRSINEKSENKESAYEFIKFVASPAAVLKSSVPKWDGGFFVWKQAHGSDSCLLFL